jgi:hypothetical protein
VPLCFLGPYPSLPDWTSTSGKSPRVQSPPPFQALFLIITRLISQPSQPSCPPPNQPRQPQSPLHCSQHNQTMRNTRDRTIHHRLAQQSQTRLPHCPSKPRSTRQPQLTGLAPQATNDRPGVSALSSSQRYPHPGRCCSTKTNVYKSDVLL